jgi:hypothetical protein
MRAAIIILWLLFALAATAGAASLLMLAMPGRSFRGPLPPLSEEERALSVRLSKHIEELSLTIGPRNLWHPKGLARAAAYVQNVFEAAGLQVKHQRFDCRGIPVMNLEAEVPGRTRPDEIIVVGAHYDTVEGTPGANDNASGVAAMLEICARFAREPGAQTVRFVAFANEEPPFSYTESMGSWVYAKRCRARGEKISAMLSLETLAYYSDRAKSQKYPEPLSLFYPSVGNFVAFVGNVSSRTLVRRTVAVFRQQAQFPSEGAAAPAFLPGIGWSDHWSFWQEGYPAIMVTDTAPFRYPYYHSAQDTPDKLPVDSLARVVQGLTKTVQALAS